MNQATFRFAYELSPFLAPAHRGRPFAHACARAATLKNAIESLGVPHTELGAITVNGEPATLQRTVRDGDAIDVAPYRYDDSEPLVFLADAHLGGLARFLRRLGFDTLHDPRSPDLEIRRLAHEESRIVLTRDRGWKRNWRKSPPATNCRRRRGRSPCASAATCRYGRFRSRKFKTACRNGYSSYTSTSRTAVRAGASTGPARTTSA
jgi:hypothetical protein